MEAIGRQKEVFSWEVVFIHKCHVSKIYFFTPVKELGESIFCEV
jgi:hypothetical protein